MQKFKDEDMQLAAWELGVGSSLATIYQEERALQLLGFPADLGQRFALSFGCPVDAEELNAAPKRGGRRSLVETMR